VGDYQYGRRIHKHTHQQHNKLLVIINKDMGYVETRSDLIKPMLAPLNASTWLKALAPTMIMRTMSEF
jgi:hypothetical protein